MTESLLSRLSLVVESAMNDEDEGLALARYGIGLAQAGHINEASRILEGLRIRFFEASIASVSIEILLLEGVIGYYSTRNDVSLDRVRRANLLAKSLRLTGLEAESAVWLVHLGFNFDQFQVMAEGLQVSFERFGGLPTELCGRVCLCVADGSQYLGRVEESAKWYSLSRRFARMAHDHAVIAAIEYNRLGMGLARARVESLMPALRPRIDSRNWLTELGSVQRLQVGFGANALSELMLLVDSRTCELENDFSGAIRALVAIQSAGAADKCGMTPQLLELEIIWCQSKNEALEDSVLRRVTDLGSVDEFPLAEQIIALRYIQDISRAADVELDSVRFEMMMARAVDCIAALDLELGRCIDMAKTHLGIVELELAARSKL